MCLIDDIYFGQRGKPKTCRLRYLNVIMFRYGSAGIMALVILLLPGPTLGNGGDQRVVAGKYIIVVSRAPFTPRAGEENKMLVSFADIAKDQLIADDLLVSIRIAKLNRGQDKENYFLFQKERVAVHGGVLEFPYTFSETGLHELFLDFAFASHPEKFYEAPDFLLDVQPALATPTSTATKPIVKISLRPANLLTLIITAGVGGMVGWFIARHR